MLKNADLAAETLKKVVEKFGTKGYPLSIFFKISHF